MPLSRGWTNTSLATAKYCPALISRSCRRSPEGALDAASVPTVLETLHVMPLSCVRAGRSSERGGDVSRFPFNDVAILPTLKETLLARRV